MRTVYYPGLNALRFYAAVSVVIAHLLFSFQPIRPLPLQGSILELFFLDGGAAVTFFFVLSGFLITALLLTEKAQNGTIRVRAFWIRRILRIWPLYYLVAFFGISIYPSIAGSQYRIDIFGSAAIALLLANVANVGVGMLNHLWSISLEEQFYLLWPLMMKQRWITPITVMLGVIALRLFLTPVALATTVVEFQHLWVVNRIESMCIGGLAAWIALREPDLLKAVHRFQLPILCLFAVFVVVEFPESIPITIAGSLTFAGLIINVATHPQSLLRLETPLMKQLGNISYGIYMFHFPVLFVLCVALQSHPVTFFTNAFLFVGTFTLTLSLAWGSHLWFEAPFIRMKRRFSQHSTI